MRNVIRNFMFLSCVVMFAVYGCGDRSSETQPGSFDMIITNARILDGTGNPWYRGEIGIKEKRILTITAPGRLEAEQSRRVIDAGDNIVCPGFIDMMGASSVDLLIDSRAASKITQGITLSISGEGSSVAPAHEQTAEEKRQYKERWGIDHDWITLDDFFKKLEASPPAHNFGTFVGSGGLRELIAGSVNRPLTSDELNEMKRLTAEAMEDGALGLASALMYIPDRFNSTEELIELAKVTERYGGIYITHQRSESDAIFESLEEVFRIAREANILTEIFHLKMAYKQNFGKMSEVVKKIEEARQQGLEIIADVYPYVRGATGISAILPNWVNEGSSEQRNERLRDPQLRERIKKELVTPSLDWENEYYGTGADKIFVSQIYSEKYEQYEGMSLEEIGSKLNQDPRDVLMDIVLAGGSSIITEIMAEKDVILALQQRWASFNTDSENAAPDGPLSGGLPHPRAYGSFTRILGRYVREKQIMTLEEAVRKATSLPAQTLRIYDRGLLKSGYYADIVIFNPETVKDKATYKNPHQYSEGIDYVIVNGEVVVDHGVITEARPGMVVRGPGYKSKH